MSDHEIPANIAALINKGKAHQKKPDVDSLPIDEVEAVTSEDKANIDVTDDLENNEVVGSVENNEVESDSSKKNMSLLSSIPRKAFDLYMVSFKKNKAVTLIITLLFGLYILSSLTSTDNKEKPESNEGDIASTINIEQESIELEGFGNIEIPDVADPFESVLDSPIVEPVIIDPSEKINSMAMSEQVIPNEDDLNDILDDASNEKISDLQLEVDTVSTRVSTIEEYSSTEIERLISEVKTLTTELTNVKNEVQKKKFDLGYEKDRPDIKLYATAPAPDDCSDCIAHASFKFDNIDYQAGNDSVWHSFKVQIAGNRMSLISNDYVYDYWVGE